MVSLVRIRNDSYRGCVTVPAPRGVSLYVRAGECCVIMGTSGNVKNTLRNVPAGLGSVTSGDLSYAGPSMRCFSGADWMRCRRERIGMVLQAWHLVPGFAAADNVGSPWRLRTMPCTRMWERARETLGQAGVRHRAGHRLGELSGGEQPRVAPARASVHRPCLLPADAPTGNFDAHALESVTPVRRVALAESQTVLFVTRSEAAARVADRVDGLCDGRRPLRSSRMTSDTGHGPGMS